jgi:hypothetical protein
MTSASGFVLSAVGNLSQALIDAFEAFSDDPKHPEHEDPKRRDNRKSQKGNLHI